MADDQRLIQFLSSWNELRSEDKAEALREFEFKPLPQFQPPSPTASATEPPEDSTQETRDGIQLYSYYSYLCYYPTIRWKLDKNPETDDYWIGVYEAGAANNEYTAYLWIGRAAEGSYDVGCLNTAAGKQSNERRDKFELRLFNGDCQITDVETNTLLGNVLHAHTRDILEVRPPVTVEEPRTFFTDIRPFVQQSGDVTPKPWASLRGMLLHLWDELWSSEQQHLYPFLEHYSHSNSVRNPENRPEPKLCFGSCSKKIFGPYATTYPQLTFGTTHSFAYIYPAVNVIEAIPSAYAYIGLCETKR